MVESINFKLLRQLCYMTGHYSTDTDVYTEISRRWILELQNWKLSHFVAEDSSSLSYAAMVTDVSNDRVAFIFIS